MAELVIPPDNATTEGTGTANAPYIIATDVVGGTTSGTSVSAWVDGLDTSYVKSDFQRSSKGNYPNWETQPDPPAAADVTAIGVRFRARKGAGSSGWFIVQLFGQASKLLSTPSNGGILALGFGTVEDWKDFDYVIDAGEYDTEGWAPNGVQSALEQTFIYARTRPVSDSTGEFLGDGTIEVAEQRIVLYYSDVETPCDTDIDLDLSSAVFLDNGGTLSGQYVDGVITSTDDFLQPDFYIPDLTLDANSIYRVTFTYDPTSSHDGGQREAYVSGLRPGHEQDDVDTAYTAGDEYSDIAVWWDTWTETGDTLTFTVGPGRGPGPVGDHVSGVVSWDDDTYGVAAGYTAPWFESAAGAALSGITIRKLCTFITPPLRQYPRWDGLGASSVRRLYPLPPTIQASNRRGPSAIL